ncbi:curli assembly protein CsgF [Massilia solisilvae]|uniref:Curli production assembly/transport component CsgF n=1 Tax=Massilia solisilvae TaxID=1811225 RepID=A0ABT2BJ70_9BURK|nr:curli assembly protein CsgF [Massilia solisilvae]MCS0607968.1 curli assembly protein CsgF [Massilia solisilvae]
MAKHLYLAALLCACTAVLPAAATELVYTPVNPAFGGSPLNGPGLLASAQATNKHKDPLAARNSLLDKSPLEQFTDMLERSILSQLSAAAMSGVIGQNGKLQPGTVDTGNFRITIVDSGGGVLTITTTDKTTGASTTFQIGGQ